MERDKYMPQGGDLARDLEEKEGSVETFDKSLQHSPGGDREEGSHASEGVMGDSRPDQTDPQTAHFVDASDDPNMRITRRTSELTEPERDLAEEVSSIEHEGVTKSVNPQSAAGDEEGKQRLARDVREE